MTTTDVITPDASGNFRPDGAHMPRRSNAAAKRTDKGEVEWEGNPFWGAFELDTRRKRITINEDAVVLLNTRTGEETRTAEISKVYEIDTNRFVKVYAQHLKVFFDLSQVGIKLLEVIMHEMSREHNSDCIYLSASSAGDYFKKTGRKYSQASYYRGREELLSKGFIARSTRTHIYWINPALFWNGDRVKFITELRPAPAILPPDKEASAHCTGQVLDAEVGKG